MNILNLRRRLLVHLLVPLLVFLGSFTALAVFFSQQSGHVLWENLVASALLAAMLAFFAFICMLSKWTFALWAIGTILFMVIGHLGYSFGDTYSPCFVSFYCLGHHVSHWQLLLIQSPLEAIFFIDIIVGFKLGVHTLVALNAVYPQTRYFIGAFLMGLFSSLLGLTQRIHNVTDYNALQYAVLSIITLLAIASFCFGIFYKKIGDRIDKYKRIYGAAVLSCIPLLTVLIPFDVSTPEAAKEALIFRIAFSALAIFCFVYIGFFAKVRLGTQTLNGTGSIQRSKNKGSSH